MCLICVEFQKQRLTLSEARRNFSEMVDQVDPKHVREVEKMFEEAETKANEKNNP